MIARGTGMLVLVGCGLQPHATEIIVTVDTSFGVPCTIDTLHFEVTGDRGPVTADVPLTGAELPGSLALVPSGNASQATVSVTGMRQGDPFVVAQDEVAFDDHRSIELRFVLDRSCLVAPYGPGPCPAVGAGAYEGLPPPLPRRGCGEAGYAIAAPLFEMRDACSMPGALATAVLPDMAEAEAELPPLPFPFSFYGQPAAPLWVGTNGYVAVAPAAPNALTIDIGYPRSLGDAGSFPVSAVLAFWDVLRTGKRGICYATSGQFPDRMFWITWKEACFAAGTTPCGSAAQGLLTFGVALEETTDRVYLGYLDMTATDTGRADGRDATIGITAGASTLGCPASACGSDGACSTGGPCGYTEVSAQTALQPLPTVELDPQ